MFPRSRAPWISVLDRRLAGAVEGGIVRYIEARSLPLRHLGLLKTGVPAKPAAAPSQPEALGLTHVVGVFVVLGVVLVLAGAVFAVEVAKGRVTRIKAAVII